MYIITLLILALLANIVRCPGAGGGGGGGGGGGSGSSSRSKPCVTEECRVRQNIGSGVILVIGLGLIIYWIYRYCKRGLPSQVNADFIRQNFRNNRNCERDPFESGVWSFRYYQYRKWHGPFQLPLIFDHSLSKAIGQGTDDVGSFDIDGIFSSENLRLGLTQKYQEGTGDPKENRAHISTIQLQWNSVKNRFDGKWYIRVNNYRGDGAFKLKLEESLAPLLDSDTAC